MRHVRHAATGSAGFRSVRQPAPARRFSPGFGPRAGFVAGITALLAMAPAALATVQGSQDNRNGMIAAWDGGGDDPTEFSFNVDPSDLYDPINWDQTVQDSGRIAHLVHSSDWFGANPGSSTTGFTITETYTVMKPAGPGYAKGNEFSTLSLHVTGVGGPVPFQFFGSLTETGANASGEIKLTGPGVNVTKNTTTSWDQTVNLVNGDYFLTVSVNVAVDTTPAASKSVALSVTLLQGSACDGDINHDGTVNGADLGLLLGAWGSNNASADINDDGTVNGADLGLLLGNWGGC